MTVMAKKVAFDKLEATTGEAECAATQTVHFAASSELEWWCVVSAYADHRVSNKHSQEMRLEIPLMEACLIKRYQRIYTGKEQVATSIQRGGRGVLAWTAALDNRHRRSDQAIKEEPGLCFSVGEKSPIINSIYNDYRQLYDECHNARYQVHISFAQPDVQQAAKWLVNRKNQDFNVDLMERLASTVTENPVPSEFFDNRRKTNQDMP
jgi:hypothetical protein